MTETIPKCDCGQDVDREMIELAAMFPKILTADKCGECMEAANHVAEQRATEEKRRQDEAARVARLEMIPPEIRRTSITHKTFNAGLWVRIEGWRPSGLKWLGIYGPPGHCKTRCLGLLVKRLILDGHHVTWTTALEFQDRVDDLRSDEKGAPGEARAYLKRCKSTGILVLDDIGKNTWNPSMERHLFDVIDHRKTHDLPVLWTANTHPVEILRSGLITKDRAGALIGRLIEASKIEEV